MWKTKKTIKEENMFRKFEEGELIMIYNKDELKTYDDIKNKFKNFRLDEEYELELKEEGCVSITNFQFFLHDDKEEYNILFLLKLKIDSRAQLRYFDFITNEAYTSEVLNDFHKNNCVKIVYETEFFKFNPFDDEDDDDEEQEEPPPLALSYPSDQCVICYEEKPNILNYPCLHLSQCEACDEKGKFNKCVICKDEIEYRIKI